MHTCVNHSLLNITHSKAVSDDELRKIEEKKCFLLFSPLLCFNLVRLGEMTVSISSVLDPC